MVNILLDLLFPKQCFVCSKYGNYLCSPCISGHIQFEQNKVCHVCQSWIVGKDRYVHGGCKNLTNIQKIQFILRFSKVPKKLIQLIKYQNYFSYIDVMVDLTLQNLDLELLSNAILVPVPLHKSKQKLRGFNQAELYAKKLVEKLGQMGIRVPVLNLLMRTRKTITQVGMDKTHRLQNLRGAFELGSSIKVSKARKIVLIDDVYTSGSTLEECAGVLKSAEFSRVEGLVFARA